MSGFWWHRGWSPLGGGGPCGEQQPTFKVLCRAFEGRCLAVRDDAFVLAPADRADEHQHWFKDTRVSLRVKDKEGKPVFSLVNKVPGLAVQHSLGPNRPVRLVKINPEDFDESVLWTESGHLGRDFGRIRMMHDVGFGLDASPGGDDGAALFLSNRTGGDTRSWKILFWNDEANSPLAGLEAEPTCRIYCKADEGFSVTICDGNICLAPTDPDDVYQHWIQDKRPGNMIRDEDGYPAFALVNKVTGDAIRGSEGDGRPTKLVPYNPFYLDVSVLWTTSWDMGHGFRCIQSVDNTSLNFDAFHGDDTTIMLSHWRESDDLQWKIVPWYMSPCAAS
ncbi:ricin B-like lectin R40C1 isoform X2 [Panicum virgatum]|nr:ricin B-like lectin R40C1 isoform X2 [Panicum virgatum]